VTYFNIAQSVNAWYSSRLYRVTLTDVWYFLPVLVIGILLLIVLRKQLNILAFGKELTTVIGMNRNLLNGLLSFVVILLTGISVAIVGRLSFIGLVVPHMSRLLIGKRYSDNVLGSDYLSRWLNYPFETPTSVVIALIGVPLFLFLIKKGAGVSYD
jgi:iron complex transport system permease protein